MHPQFSPKPLLGVNFGFAVLTRGILSRVRVTSSRKFPPKKSFIFLFTWLQPSFQSSASNLDDAHPKLGGNSTDRDLFVWLLGEPFMDYKAPTASRVRELLPVCAYVYIYIYRYIHMYACVLYRYISFICMYACMHYVGSM